MPELSDSAAPSPSPEMAAILENLQKQKLSTTRQNVINSSTSTSSVKETSSSQQVCSRQPTVTLLFVDKRMQSVYMFSRVYVLASVRTLYRQAFCFILSLFRFIGVQLYTQSTHPEFVESCSSYALRPWTCTVRWTRTLNVFIVSNA